MKKLTFFVTIAILLIMWILKGVASIMITLEALLAYLRIGFKPVPLNELSGAPTITWSEIYFNSDFWSRQKVTEHLHIFHNIATTFGQTHVTDSDGRKLYLYCLDIDSEEVLQRITTLLEQEWKAKTFVTKTQKDCGYHVYWFEHSGDNNPISIEGCKKGFGFEIKCGKSLCTLPPSRHRDNPYFHYGSVGEADKIMTADGLYDQLVSRLLADCLKRRKEKPKKNVYVAEDIHNHDAVVSQEPIADNKIDSYVTASSHLPKRVLTKEQIDRSFQYLVPYYQEKTRDKFAFGFSGLTYKEGIDEESAAKILQSICTIKKDAETNSRVETLHRTYVKGNETGSESITGKAKLKEVVSHVAECEEEAAEKIIQGLINIWSGDDEPKSEKYDAHNMVEDYGKNHNNNINNKQSFSVAVTLLHELVAAGIHYPAEYAISVVNKTVKCDDSSTNSSSYSVSRYRKTRRRRRRRRSESRSTGK
jgi:hypothetical protein